MLWEARFWPLIADGSVTVTFRRWKRPQAVEGRRYRTPGGIVEVESRDVAEVELDRQGAVAGSASRFVEQPIPEPRSKQVRRGAP